LPDKAVVADIIDSTRLLPWGHWWILRRRRALDRKPLSLVHALP
jgi:hypothetical protein